jgi:hypothetical protein
MTLLLKKPFDIGRARSEAASGTGDHRAVALAVAFPTISKRAV